MSRLLAEQRLLLCRRGVGLLDGEPERARPHPLRSHGQRSGHLATGTDAPGGQYRRGGHRADDLGPQHDAADLAGVPPALGALGDDDVDARAGVLAGLVGRARERPRVARCPGSRPGRRRGACPGRWRSGACSRAGGPPRPAVWPWPPSTRGAGRCGARPRGASARRGQRGAWRRSRGAAGAPSPGGPSPASPGRARPCPRTFPGSRRRRRRGDHRCCRRSSPARWRAARG